MAEPRTDPPRGLLNLDLDRASDRISLKRYVPTAAVGSLVEHLWVIRWDLRGLAPFTSESLPYPSVHLVLTSGQWEVRGVTRGKFSRTLRDAGAVFGVKFKPGGFRPFMGESVSTLTDQVVPATHVVDFADQLATTQVADAQMVEHVEAVLRRNLPVRDERIPMLTQLVETVANDRSIVRVEQLVDSAGLSKRALQRLFHDYVGVSPKWVIQRYRLFEAAERLASGESDGARVAQELGYFDQAHFVRDFKAMVGESPRAFAVRRNVA